MDYDIICIGAGSGGLNIASFMNRVGFKVLLIDKSDASIGGDCLNTGCVPSKALLHVAKQIQETKHSNAFGLKTTGSIDLKKVMDYVRTKQNVIREHENAAYFRKKGMDVVLGKATFAGPHQVTVNGKTYSAKKIVLATGSSPRQLDIPGVDKVSYLTNENIFELTKLPKQLVVIGGGPIGIEMAQAFTRFGSKVTVIENGKQFLPKEAPEMANILYEQLKKEGLTVLFESKTIEFKDKNTLIIEQKGKKKELTFDNVLVSIGRQLNIEGLDLDKAHIELDESGKKLKVNEYLQTTNKHIYVCGDVAGSYQFTHAAELHASVILNNFFNPLKKKKLNNDSLSWVTYTSPEIATFGLNRKILKERNISYEKIEMDFVHDDRAIVDETTAGKTQLYIADDRILGGSMVAENAGELFQELVLAQTLKIPIKQMFTKTYPYPTASTVNKKIIGQHMAKKLTDKTKAILRWLY